MDFKITKPIQKQQQPIIHVTYTLFSIIFEIKFIPKKNQKNKKKIL